MAKKWVYLYEEGNKDMKDLLGGKGAGLAEMANAGLPVPPGLTITTEACNAYFDAGKKFPEGMWEQTLEALRRVEERAGKKFGDPKNPLLVSVRSGARISMPGMMDTILNVGLNPDTLQGLARLTGNERFAWDAYRRLVQMFGNIVKELDRHKFEAILDEYKAKTEGGQDTDLTTEMLKEVTADFKVYYREELGEEFPDDPYEQLRQAIGAVFDSWFSRPAVSYRKAEGISHDWGTAVNVVTMVFGNMGWDSGSGVGFTRDPATGEKKIMGEYLLNAQGEDVVAGIRTPKHIREMEEELPEAYGDLVRICDLLEHHYRDVQDIEFTIERGKLWMLQTRTGKRTAAAAVEIAVDMVKEGLITKEEALMRVTPKQVGQFLHPRFDPKAKERAKEGGNFLAIGLNASPGAATGTAIFDADTAEERGRAGEAVILVRPETNPDDVHGMEQAQGILTQHGGMTCIAGEIKVLTDQGFLTAEEAYCRLACGEALRILAFDHRSGHSVWRNVIAAGQRQADVCTVAISQTGRAKHNTLRLTPDHEMFTVQNRQLRKKKLEDCLNDGDFLCIPSYVPALNGALAHEAALVYCAGAIFTDGYVNLKPTKGSVTFCQKNVPEKQPSIEAVHTSFAEAFGTPFTYTRQRQTETTLRGPTIAGSVQEAICFHREPAQVLIDTWDNMVPWVLSLDRDSLLHFLAGVLDGDGTFNLESNRINLFVSKEQLLQGIVAALLRLGIVPQVINNRQIYNIQVSAGFAEVLERAKRVKDEERDRLYDHRLFSVRSLFTDMVDQVNYMGRVREGIKRNILFGADKIERDLLPLCPPQLKDEVEALLNSDLRMYRVRQVGGLKPETVYNFEVDATDELDKNFVAFTQQYTPVLISNSHAAIVARSWGKPCVAGCEAVKIDLDARKFSVNEREIREGDFISIDGATGEVFAGALDTVEPDFKEEVELKTLLSWADEVRRLGVWTNADYPKDAAKARSFGAQGIGLCRTEHMFFEEERRPIVVKMIMAEEERQRFLDQLLPFQREDFEGLFRAMDGCPVIIRLIDPPMHEFLPPREELIEEVTRLRCTNDDPQRLAEKEKMLQVVESMWEINPMLGLRGCRAGIMYKGLTEMQVRAIFEAACNVAKVGVDVHPEVMIPLTSHINELKLERDKLERVAKDVMAEKGIEVDYKFGTMIEIPRACLTADEIAEHADFFSFGTNDLTQMTFGFSRDDMEGKFLVPYLEKGILENNPFETLDREGVGKLVDMAVKLGRATKPDLEIGICGEHGGDPSSIEFCHQVGLNYVSCSPFRVPIARLAAAHAALKRE